MRIKEMFKDLIDGIKNVFTEDKNKDNLYSLNNTVPLKKAIPLGLQHILVMFAANITPLIIIFSSLNIPRNSEVTVYAMLGALFMASIGTIIQLLIGARLPVVLGTSFTFVPIFIAIGVSAGGGEEGYYTILGSIIVGGIVAIILSIFYKWWHKIIKPIVPAIVILGIGLALLSSGANQFFGGTTIISNIILEGKTGTNIPYYVYIILAFITLIVAILWYILIPGIWKNINIIVAIIFSYIVACFIPGMIDFSILKIDFNNIISEHGIFTYPHFITFSKLKFSLVPCLLTSICFMVSIGETIGSINALCVSSMERDPNNREINGALINLGINNTIVALFGAFPLTVYAENVGIVAQTKIINRFTIFCGALVLLIASFLAPIANFIYSIPDVIIGGTMVILFGSIVVVGMKSISKIGWTDKNIIITSICLCLGFGLTIANVTFNTDSVINATQTINILC